MTPLTYYAGVGSRSTPPSVLTLMEQIAAALAQRGYVLRSGGALGADTAFESGARQAGGARHIFYTDNWKAARGRSNPERAWPPADAGVRYPYERLRWLSAAHIAKMHHPAWERCTERARALHTRNVFQVLGVNLMEPAKMVICWTPDGAERETTRRTGGTGLAIRVADSYSVRVFNLARVESMTYITTWLGLGLAIP